MKTLESLFRKQVARPVVIFSHPNHELAIFGLIQRLRPHIVYLTDGGGCERVEETEKGLSSIGLRGRATFLNYTEASFYEALALSDHCFYEKVCEKVSGLFLALQPSLVLCDAVEFYNPIHDLSLPIARASLQNNSGAQVFEIPLIYQRPVAGEKYEVQRMSASRQAEQIEIHLTEAELEKKLSARDQIYTILAGQMGDLLCNLPRAHVGKEVVAPASPSVEDPGEDRRLRYEWRAQALLERGEIQSIITCSNHFLPITKKLLNRESKTGRTSLQA